MPESRKRRLRAALARGSLVRVTVTVLGILIAYYSMPFRVTGGRLALDVLLTMAGVVAMAWAITTQVRRQSDQRGTEPASLAVVVSLVIGLFAAGYYLIEQSQPGQFQGLATRTDSLYFTLTTLTTVGYGDVHASGQVARALVIVQQVFDVVFVAALISTYAGPLRPAARPRVLNDGTPSTRDSKEPFE